MFWGTKKANLEKDQLEEQIRILEREAVARQKDDKSQSRRDWLIGAMSLLGASAIGIFGPVLLRQERLGLAPTWTFNSLAGVGGTPMPTLGKEWDPAPFVKQGALAFREGILIISMNAEKDKNYTVTDISIHVKDSAPQEEATWYFAPPGTTGGGPSVHNLDLSFVIDSRTWVNVREPSRVFSNSKFDPFAVGGDSLATVSVWVRGKDRDYGFSVVVHYQRSGESKVEEIVVGEYAVYGVKSHLPCYTTNAKNYVIPLSSKSLS